MILACEALAERTAAVPTGREVRSQDSQNLGRLEASPSAPAAVTCWRGTTTEALESLIWAWATTWRAGGEKECLASPGTSQASETFVAAAAAEETFGVTTVERERDTADSLLRFHWEAPASSGLEGRGVTGQHQHRLA